MLLHVTADYTHKTYTDNGLPTCSIVFSYFWFQNLETMRAMLLGSVRSKNVKDTVRSRAVKRVPSLAVVFR